MRLTDGSDGTDLELTGVTTGLIEAISFDQCGLQRHYYNSVPHPRPRYALWLGYSMGIARTCHADRNEVNSHMTVPAFFSCGCADHPHIHCAEKIYLQKYPRKNLFIEKSAEIREIQMPQFLLLALAVPPHTDALVACLLWHWETPPYRQAAAWKGTELLVNPPACVGGLRKQRRRTGWPNNRLIYQRG